MTLAPFVLKAFGERDSVTPGLSRLRDRMSILTHVITILAAAAIAASARGGAVIAEAQTAVASGWEIVVLGRAQDAGIPHLNCKQALCEAVRAGKRPRERVASLGVVHAASGKAFLFDATPDFVSQVHSLTGGRPPDGIFLTHGHIGHYTGLMFLGRESIDARGVTVYATARMSAFLQANGPWSQLVSRKNIDLQTLTPDSAVDLGDGLRVTAFVVPHRDEFTDTVGYLIESRHRRALFIPDIDQWSRWSRPIRELATGVDYAFLDGTFASADEIPGRTIADIPHPLMSATRAALKGIPRQLWFIHVNHTNTELDAKDVVRDGMRFPL
jgi:pyrroloquinoline quinone biosynthesis protein B